MPPALMMGIFGGDGSGIRAQERKGQGQLVESGVLPSRCMDDRSIYEKMGIVFGEPVDGDPVFVNVTLPAGWKKQRTDHSMWSDLLDDKGRKRAGIFYKAAFYDRSAHMRAECRYGMSSFHDFCEKEVDGVKHTRTVALDGEEIVFSSEWVEDKGYGTNRANEEVVGAWLDENKPGWKDPSAYWDEE